MSFFTGILEICHNLLITPPPPSHRLESLDSKMRAYYSRREATAVSRTSDRDSPFTPMAAEIPPSRGATPRLLPRPDDEDNLLLNTPLSSPPDSSLEDCKVSGPSLNRGLYISVLAQSILGHHFIHSGHFGGNAIVHSLHRLSATFSVCIRYTFA